MWGLAGTVLILIAMAVVSFGLGYLVYRKVSVAFWAYVSVFLPSAPAFVLSLFGAKNLELVSWLSHTAGVVVFPAMMVVLDVLLIETSLLRFLRPFSGLLPRNIRIMIRIEEALRTLEKHYLMPRPERVQRVYAVGVIAGLVNMIFSLAFNLI